MHTRLAGREAMITRTGYTGDLGYELWIPNDGALARYGLGGGHLFHGEHTLDQLWIQRPALASSRYALPISGLFLCGSSAHPGGGFLGGPEALAAAAILRG